MDVDVNGKIRICERNVSRADVPVRLTTSAEPPPKAPAVRATNGCSGTIAAKRWKTRRVTFLRRRRGRRETPLGARGSKGIQCGREEGADGRRKAEPVRVSSVKRKDFKPQTSHFKLVLRQFLRCSFSDFFDSGEAGGVSPLLRSGPASGVWAWAGAAWPSAWAFSAFSR
jgi:hypothetical protein